MALYDNFSARVALDNLAPWELHFRSLTNGRDITVPAGARAWRSLTLAEVEEQISNQNAFFTGKVPSIRICDNDLRENLCVSGASFGDEAAEELLSISPRAEFEEALKARVITRAQCRMLADYLSRRGAGDIEAYKLAAVKRHTGFASPEAAD